MGSVWFDAAEFIWRKGELRYTVTIVVNGSWIIQKPNFNTIVQFMAPGVESILQIKQVMTGFGHYTQFHWNADDLKG